MRRDAAERWRFFVEYFSTLALCACARTRARYIISPEREEAVLGKYEEKVLPRLEEVGTWAKEGWTEKEIADELKISYSGFRNYKKQHLELVGILTENKKIADSAAKGALFQKVIGQSYIKEIRERDENGRLVIVKKETVVIPPDTQAAKFWLANRDPENWKNRETKDINAHVDANIEDFI